MNNHIDTEVARERSKTYRGTAKIPLNQIMIHCELDPKNVTRLSRVFEKEGCRRLDMRNHVTALVSELHLADALNSAGLDAGTLMTIQPGEYPFLQFLPGQIRCLHGRHRLEAGKIILAQSEQWWTVDLYLDVISTNLQTVLIEEYANERKPHDGEIYRKIRQYQLEGNVQFVERWKLRLSSQNKLKRLQQLSARVEVREAFDALLPITGLWAGLNIGSLHRMLALKCDEEIIHYLEDMRLYWFFLVDNDKTQMAKITAQDVDNLQLLAPGISSADATLVKKGIFSGELFAGFELPTRMSIWGKLRNTKRIIPSFYTFFKDLNYLEPCANCIKRLVTLSSLRPTLQSAMRGIFQPQAGLLVQTSETDFHQHSAPAIDQFDLHYRQLWLYAMRHYPDIPRVVDSDDIVAKPRCQEADETVLFNMALLAKRLGFDSPQIRRLLEHSPDRKIARAALLKARKPDRYQYNARNFESLVSRIAECFSEAGPICKDVRTDIRYETKLKSRCGLPLIQSQRQDRHSMFLDTLQKGDVPNEISTFFVRKNVFSAFFGRLHAYISLKEPGLVPTSPTVRSEANGQTRDGKPRGENDLHEPEIAERPSLGSSCAGGEKGIHLPCKEAASHIYSEGSKKCQLTQEGVNSTSTDQEPLMERSSSPQLACASITTCVTEGFKAPEAGDASPCSKRPYRARSPGDGTELSLYYSEQNTLEASTTPQQQLPSDKSITIYFQCLDRGEWKQYHSMTVDPSDPSTVERMAKKSARNHGAFFYDKQLRTLSPAQCFEAAIEDGTNTIFMSLGGELLMTENMLASVSSYLDRPTGRLTTSPSV